MDAVQILQHSLALLQTVSTEMEVFLGNWREKYAGLEENYQAFNDLVKQLNNELTLQVKESRDYKRWHELLITAKELQTTSLRL